VQKSTLFSLLLLWYNTENKGGLDSQLYIAVFLSDWNSLYHWKNRLVDSRTEMAHDKARHGRGLDGLLKRYFK
jgi:hypothetical protein